ncbi:M20/M25/M40 family metallo-hydrolase [Croceicoccus mobilis]|uniref:Peptidase n=1 Tax=Croceicoccus mobilis TaxID=1703339 RepID=A0A916YXD2_9SPHN|nr:M20/M25/M40 family metallo-hydrolase [Croceicoccus mobilis]GGD65822.1 peptidase [Croceicoccus mobilis]
MKPASALIALTCAALTFASGGPAHAGDRVTAPEAARQVFPEFIEFLKIPNVMHLSVEDMQRNADWLEAAFRRHGFDARQLEDGETPMVFAQAADPSPDRKTVLFYAHMDGQAVFPKEWDQPDPFTPVLKQRGAGGEWSPIALESLTGSAPVDPEWRLFARSAADDKAPIMMLIAAMDMMRANGTEAAINIKIIIDSHEEGGPPTLKDVVARNRELLRADAVVMLDGPMHASNNPTLVFGHRGGMGFELKVHSANNDVHSGHFGNFAPDPSFALAHLLSTMRAPDGRVLIPGFYDGVDMNPGMKAVLAAVPDDEAAIRKRIGIAESEHVGDNYQEAMNYPTFNITSMIAGEPGSRRSIIPAFAAARVSSRTVPGTPPARQLALVRNWVEAQGYHLVDGEPTEEERLKYPLLASITGGGGMSALMTPLDAGVGKWAASAMRREFGVDPVRIPIMGGGVPTQPLANGLGAPILLVPLVNADNNQHAANENLRIGNFEAGVRTLRALFTQDLSAGD